MTNTASRSALGKPGTAQLDVPWEELGFEFRPTKSHVRIVFKNGEWGPMELEKVSFRNVLCSQRLTFDLG